MHARTIRIGALTLLLALFSALATVPAYATENVGEWVTGRFDNYKDLYFGDSRWCILRFNDDGSAHVRIEQRAWNQPGKFNQWTHNYTLLLDGREVGRITHDPRENWTDGNIRSASCDFVVPKGKHHLTTTSERINDDTVVNYEWDFWISIPFDINSTAGPGGWINPNGNSKADPGSTKTYTVGSNTGYRIKDLIVDGTSQGAKSSHTFNNIDRDHSISVTFQKTWNVTFRDHDGTVIKRQTVDDGTSATPPGNPGRDGYTFTGWDKSFTKIDRDTDITATYKPNISVRVPTLVACTVLPTGEVLEPTGYRIENLSKVAVRTTSIKVANQSPKTTLHLSSVSGEVWSSAGVNKGFSIPHNSHIPLTWKVDDLKAADNAALLAASLKAAAKVADVTFTFEAA